jgi:hypothetical protein
MTGWRCQCMTGWHWLCLRMGWVTLALPVHGGVALALPVLKRVPTLNDFLFGHDEGESTTRVFLDASPVDSK